MKKFFYTLYALFFNIFRRLCRVDPRRAAFVAPHNGGEHDSLNVMKRYVERKGGFETVLISTQALKPDFSGIGAFFRSCAGALKFFTADARQMAKAKYVFLNDNFMPMAKLNFSPEAVVVQLWHAEGAFKRFGLGAPVTEEIIKREKACSERLDYIICSSKNVSGIYAEAFGTKPEKVLPLGSPRIDELLSPCDTAKLREDFDAKYPGCRGKKLVLYAPTFRDDPSADSSLTKRISTEKFNSALGGEYSFLIKLHPQINSASPAPGAVDVTGEDIGMLTRICDILVTDYSSVCMDFALLSKPCIFYAFDLEEYEKERSFYFDYKSYVPGPVVSTDDEVIEAIKNPPAGEEALRRFREFNFDFADTSNAERIYNAVISASPK